VVAGFRGGGVEIYNSHSDSRGDVAAFTDLEGYFAR
jgi:hypothetical protein